MMLLKKKKGYQVGDLLPLGITFVVLAIALTFGARVTEDIRWTQCTENATTHNCVVGTDTPASNISLQGLNSLATFADWLPTIALIVVAAVIIGVIVVYLAGRFG